MEINTKRSEKVLFWRQFPPLNSSFYLVLIVVNWYNFLNYASLSPAMSHSYVKYGFHGGQAGTREKLGTDLDETMVYLA